MAEEPTREDRLASYGFVAKLADAVPAIRDILNQALDGEWTADRFVMAVADTDWWNNTSAADREWIIKNATDPASAEDDIFNGKAMIREQLALLGFPEGIGKAGNFTVDDRLEMLYIKARTTGFAQNETTMRQYLFNEMMQQGTFAGQEMNLGGLYGRYVTDSFRAAKDYGYSSNDLTGEVINFVNSVMRNGGQPNSEAWQRKMINYAEAKYAPYAEDIRGGKTVAEIARPVVDRVSQLLEMNPDAMDWNDPIMKKALTEWGAENRAYSLNEIENFTRQDARWKKTDNAMESSVKLLNEIGQTFGFLGNR
jgi:hypothetical protein